MRSPSVFMNVVMSKQCTLNKQILWCDKAYYSNTNISTNFMWTLIPSCWFESILFPYFCTEIS